MWCDNRPAYMLSTILSIYLRVPDNLPTVQRHLKNETGVEVPLPRPWLRIQKI